MIQWVHTTGNHTVKRDGSDVYLTMRMNLQKIRYKVKEKQIYMGDKTAFM